MVTIGLALTQNIKPVIQALCNATRKGVFIESANCEELNRAFEQLSALIAPMDVTIESLLIDANN